MPQFEGKPGIARLKVAVGTGDTSWTVADGYGARFGATPFWATVRGLGDGIPEERIKVTARSTDVLTVVRAQLELR